jgi:hypothetical protein
VVEYKISDNLIEVDARTRSAIWGQNILILLANSLRAHFLARTRHATLRCRGNRGGAVQSALAFANSIIISGKAYAKRHLLPH